MPEALRPARPPAAPDAPRPLSVRDRLILDIARRGPDSALHLGGLLLFPGPPPDREELVAHLASRVLAAPELTYRLGGSGRRPAWAPDPRFDVRRHVHRITCPGRPSAESPDATTAWADAALRAVLDRPLDREHPLWGVWLIECDPADEASGGGPLPGGGGAGAGGFALCYRAHHGFQDGRAAAETIERLFGPLGYQRPAPPHATQLATGPARRDWGRTVLRDLLPPLRRVPGTRWPAIDAVEGRERLAVTGSYPLAPLYDVARATRTGLTQVCLSVMTGALRDWHPETWADGNTGPSGPSGPGTVPPPYADGPEAAVATGSGSGGSRERVLRATFGISLRPHDDPLRLLGNRGGVATVPLPCGEPAPLRRLRLLARDAGHARLSSIGRRHRVLFERMPYWCGRLGLSRGIDPRHVPLTLADVRMRSRLSWAGRDAVAFFPVPVSVPGQPLFVVWSVYGERLHATFLADAAVPGATELPALWRSSLDTLCRHARLPEHAH
ncbi:wax ester/triacylglycerol synthase domain-containing protein [Streptomyces cacaoi]|uniref:wax ester/triacylglycerol synthase domain-containing protein n=1 Tax=Streptomyces cacaoi TaxID=1898 RepID=UPI00331A6441